MRSRGSTSLRQKSSTQSSFFWKSGSVEESQPIDSFRPFFARPLRGPRFVHGRSRDVLTGSFPTPRKGTDGVVCGGFVDPTCRTLAERAHSVQCGMSHDRVSRGGRSLLRWAGAAPPSQSVEPTAVPHHIEDLVEGLRVARNDPRQNGRNRRRVDGSLRLEQFLGRCIARDRFEILERR